MTMPIRAAVALAMVVVSIGGASAREAVMPLHETPRPVPRIAFVDGDGRERTLEDFRGRIVLLNLWATWCVPCVEEMPTLDDLQKELGGPGFEVVALSVDRGGAQAIDEFYEALGLGFLAIHNDPSADAFAKLGAGALPTTLLIDREGREVGRLVGPAEWDAPEMIAWLRRFVPEAGSRAARAAPRRSVWRSREP